MPCLRAPAKNAPGLLTALGSTGFQTAPLLADQIAAEITGTPGALDQDIMRAVHPDRFKA